MSSTRRTLTPARYISISASSTRRLAPPVTLDDRRFEEQVAQLRNAQRYFAGLGLKTPVIAPGTRIHGLRCVRSVSPRKAGPPRRPAMRSTSPPLSTAPPHPMRLNCALHRSELPALRSPWCRSPAHLPVHSRLHLARLGGLAPPACTNLTSLQLVLNVRKIAYVIASRPSGHLNVSGLCGLGPKV